ncbi:hypothetical protein SETIT_8G033900v2 [Setaria italica]|uniref:Uncharacterized protein n=1 Tax=Setaria italica TaxID=4555 RepID=A0A368S3S1_SETIT|nr:hypothetical protein SETIT_8G033900v2 [Setaria italica]
MALHLEAKAITNQDADAATTTAATADHRQERQERDAGRPRRRPADEDGGGDCRPRRRRAVRARHRPPRRPRRRPRSPSQPSQPFCCRRYRRRRRARTAGQLPSAGAVGEQRGAGPGQQGAAVVPPLLRLLQLEEAHLHRRRQQEVSWTVTWEFGVFLLLQQGLRDHGELLSEVLSVEPLKDPSKLAPFVSRNSTDRANVIHFCTHLWPGRSTIN